MKTYYLVIEYRPNDFMPIDINIMLNNNVHQNYQTIEAIDTVTKKYTKDELFNFIKETNIVPEKYYEGTLNIINDKKYRFGLLSKDCDLDIAVFLQKNISNKTLMNKIVNVYHKYDGKNIDEFKTSLKEQNVQKTLAILFNNEYIVIRQIYMYIYLNLV